MKLPGLALSALLGLISCTPPALERGVGPGGTQEGVEASLQALRRVPRAASILAGAGPLGDGQIERSGLHASLPRSSGAPLVLFEDGTGVRAEVFALMDRRDVPSRATGSARVLLDATPGVDVIHVASGPAIEELRVLRDARAPAVLRWHVRVSDAVGEVRAREGRIEIVRRDGWVSIAAAPMWAQDARGVIRELVVNVARGGDAFVVEARFDAHDLVHPIVVDPAWSAGPTMTTPRRFHSVVPLSATSFLVIGGESVVVPVPPGPLAVVPQSTCEIYDASTNTFSVTGSMATPRASTGASRLADGRVIVAGGRPTLGTTTSTAEIYDPKTGKWSSAGALQLPRHSSNLVLLPGGDVLAVGGYPYGPTKVCDLWTLTKEDPVNGGWQTTGSMAFDRGHPAVQLLSTGKVLVAGGWYHGPTLSTAEVYDPARGTFALTGSMNEPRHSAASAQLASGKVVVFGGTGIDSDSSSSELYDPASGTWALGPSAASTRTQSFVTVLSNGRLLVGGEVSTRGATIYDPATNTFLGTPSFTQPRDGAVAIPLSDGRALVAGGGAIRESTSIQSTTELYLPAANGAACVSAGECLSGFCASLVCCNAACTGYRCTGGACPLACTTDATCAPGFYCDGSACVAKKPAEKGSRCSRAAECSSASCVDGYCCDRACTGQCEACDVAGALGTCVPAKGAPHGSRAPCVGVGAGTVCGPSCDGSTATGCAHPSAPTPCGANTCIGGIETHQSLCNDGVCRDEPTSCGAYACGAFACHSKCTTAEQCAPGHYCAGGACFKKLDAGTECSSAATCATGFCTDGVCCDVADCGGGGSSCAVAGKRGRCTKTNGTACASPDECGSGRCVDGYCCGDPCGGQCEACDVPGKLGTCVAVAGEPHNARPKCDDGGTDVCKARACTGKDEDRSSCAGFRNGPAVPCSTAKCDGESFLPARTCDGNGACGAFSPVECSPFLCSEKGCKTTCATPDDCKLGLTCEGGACVPRAQCSADGLASIGKDGARLECLPHRCDAKTGTCATTCADSAACLGGYICDVTAGACVAAPVAAAEDDDGGCSTGRGRRVSAAWWFLVAIGLASLRRRRVRALPSIPGLALLVAVGCRAEPSLDLPVASTADQIVRSLRVWPGLAVPDENDLGATMDATFPVRASGALFIAVHDHPDASLVVVAEHAREVPAERVTGGVVFRDADPSTDTVILKDGQTVEEIRVLRDATAPTRARYRVQRGPAIASLRLVHGRLEAVGNKGRVELVAPPPYAVDARGVRRALEVSIDGDSVSTALDTTGLSFPIAVDPAWTTSAPMSTPREHHVAVSLSDGKVLVAGGWDGGDYLSTAEIYDPDTNVWTPTRSMVTARASASAMPLASGKVLVVGGRNPGRLSTAELWDPAAGTWTAVAGVMKVARFAPGLATLGSTGRVLIVGGTHLAAVDLYDSVRNTFNDPVSPPDAGVGRIGLALVPLTTGPHAGGALAIGGEPTSAFSSVEIYIAEKNAWVAAPPLAQGRTAATAFATAKGRIVVTGGTTGADPFSSTEIFDPDLGTWSAGPPIPGARLGAAAADLGSGRFLVVGGATSYTASSALSTAALWDPTRATWREGPPMSVRRRAHAVATFFGASITRNANKVLVTGGLAFTTFGKTVASTESFSLLANGQECTVPGDCSSNLCEQGLCCATACAGAYRCVTGVCPDKCGSSAECASTHYCSGAACVPKLPNGASCGSASACTSGFCVDGVCCNSGCTSPSSDTPLQCGACNVPGKLGTCSPVTGAPAAGRRACSGIGVGTECGPVCDGVDMTRCNSATAEVRCSNDACVGGVETKRSLCDGRGRCLDVPRACGAYVCGTRACNTSCTSAGDCASGFFCNGSACVPVVGLGLSCTDRSACPSDAYCTDGVCCRDASCGPGRTCAGDRKRGVCTKTRGESCTIADECASGVCVDGACCDSACEGQCQACDVPGLAGTCSPVRGAPHGSRAECGSAGPGVCQPLACDGARDPLKCVAFAADNTVECRAPFCDDGAVYHARSTCDGAGSCVAGTARSCAPYVCDATGCKTSCGSSSDCARGHVCSDAKCVSEGSCTPDGLSSIGAGGVPTACAPFRCRGDGRCGTECATTSECAPGAVCDAGARRCIAPATAEDSGGCSLTAASTSSTVAIGATLIAVLAARRRRFRPCAVRR